VFRAYMARRTGPDEIPRVETLARVFRAFATIVIFIVAGTLVLDTLGISVAAGARHRRRRGRGDRFGAQSLIKDLLRRLLPPARGPGAARRRDRGGGQERRVETWTLRHIRLRDFDGHVHFVPNGEIKVLTNRTRGYAYATMEIGASPTPPTSTRRSRSCAGRRGAAHRPGVARAHRRRPRRAGCRAPRRLGGDSAFAAEVVPAIEQWNVRREFLRRFKKPATSVASRSPSRSSRSIP